MKILLPGFERFQHYGDRRPPWVKLPRSLIQDFVFRDLSLETRMAYVGLLLLATDNATEGGDGVVKASGPKELAWALALRDEALAGALESLEHAGLARAGG